MEWYVVRPAQPSSDLWGPFPTESAATAHSATVPGSRLVESPVRKVPARIHEMEVQRRKEGLIP